MAVDGWRLQTLARQPAVPSWGRLGVVVLVAVATSALCVVVMQQVGAPAGDLSAPALATLVSLSMLPLLSRTASGLASTAAIIARISGVVVLYIGWHAGAAQLMPSPVEGANTLGWALVGLGFAGLFAVKTTLQMRPEGRLARGLYPWLFAGLYLDERFTRLTFRIWPPRLERRSETHRGLPNPETLDVRT
jgi:NAD(P)H-quinone oxidoreductase subunit 5